MSYLNNTLNQLDDPEQLESFDAFELRSVDADDPQQIVDPDDSSILMLVGVDGDVVPLHSFEDSMDPLGEIIDALIAEKATLSWRDTDSEVAIDNLEDFAIWLEDNADSPLRENALDALSDLI